MAARYEQIEYPLEQVVSVERWEEDDLTYERVQNVLALLTRSYACMEDERYLADPLPQGAIAQHFQPNNNDRIVHHRDRMLEAMANGSQYWLAHNGSIQGLIKFSPSRANILQDLRLSRANVYINDIVVDPQYRGRGIGSAMLHTALAYGGYSPRKVVALHQYAGSQANGWFADIGLQPTGSYEDHRIEGHVVAQELVDSGKLMVGGVIKNLLARRPALARATVR